MLDEGVEHYWAPSIVVLLTVSEYARLLLGTMHNTKCNHMESMLIGNNTA